MIATGLQILELIPQRPPIVMVDTLISAAEKKTVSSFTITSDNIFAQNGKFREPGLIENIAQSAALGVGYLCKVENRKVPVGFIGAIKKLSISELPNVGETIITEILVDYEVFEASIVTGKIYLNDNLIVSCEMKIFLKSIE